MRERRKNPFIAAQRQLKTDLAALGLVVCAAAVLAGLDLRGAARADAGDIPAAQALAIANEHGLGPASIDGEVARFSAEHGTRVWRVKGAQDAVIDARSGELLEVQF